MDNANGHIHLDVSSDNGAHFNDSGLSMPRVTLFAFPEGYYGYPALSAAGANVGMTWISASGKASLWTSINHATSRSPILTLTATARSKPATAAAGDRIAFAIAVSVGILTEVSPAGTFGLERLAASLTPAGLYKASDSVAVALSGDHGIGVAYSACRLPNCAPVEAPAGGIDMVWRESTNDGQHWRKPFALARSNGTSAAGKQQRMNQYASVVIVGDKRYVSWDAFSGDFSKGSQLIAIGTGTP